MQTGSLERVTSGLERGSELQDLVLERQADSTLLMKPKKVHRNTVDRRLIEERFKSLGLDLDWDRLIKLANIRNDAEHLFLKVTPTVAREVLASAMPLIERLLVEQLEEEPLAVFEDTVWQKLLENRESFEAQPARCRDTFRTVDWSGEIFTRALPFLRCLHCASPLVRCVETENMAFDTLRVECAECGEESRERRCSKRPLTM